MLVYRDHHFFHWQSKLLGCALHDANIGLVRNQPINLRGFHASDLQYFISHFLKYRYRQFEYRLTIHVQVGTTSNRTTLNSAGHA